VRPEPPAWASEREPPFWSRADWWRRSLSSSATFWASTVLVFVASVLIARALGPAEYGAVVLALSISTLVGGLLDVTFEGAVVHHGYRALAAKRLDHVRSMLRAAVAVDVSIGLGVAAVLFAAASPLAALAGGEPLTASLIRIGALGVLVKTLDGSTAAALYLAGRPDIVAAMFLVTATARLIGTVVALEIGGAQAVLWAFAVATAVGSATQGLAAWQIAWRDWARAPLGGKRREWFRTLLPFAASHSLTTTVTNSTGHLIPVTLGALTNSATVGVFSVAMLPVKFGGMLSAPLRLALSAEQAKLAAQDRRPELLRSVRWHTVIGIALGLALAIAGYFTLPWLIPLLYSQTFSEAVTPARILLVAAVAMLSIGWAKSLFIGIGRPGLQAIVAFVELALTVAALVVLVPEGGTSGAAAAVSGTSVVLALVWFRLASRILGTSRREASTPERELP
jgi:O-antigen/teichoic acid export membrane protein